VYTAINSSDAASDLTASTMAKIQQNSLEVLASGQ
jgi:hypothetical protein